MRIIFSTPDWAVSGVNTFNHNLMRALLADGHDVELVVLPLRRPVEELPLPGDVPVRILHFQRSSYRSRWAALIDHLHRAAPCIYLPGYDFSHSCVVPALRNEVGVVGVVHSDDPYHYEHMLRLGRYWNATVAVSSHVHRRILELEPLMAASCQVIHYGVPSPAELPPRPGGGPLRILYTGRFREEQKRVSDLPRIAAALARRGVAAEWTLIGGGTDEAVLRAGFARLGAAVPATFGGVLPGDKVLEHYARNDCLILTSAYEGLPISLLEAMAHGAIPVVSDLASGIPEVVDQGIEGFRLPVGDVEAYAECLAGLAADPGRRQQLHHAAYQRVARGAFSVDYVMRRYVELFEAVERAIADGSFRRPKPCRPGSHTGDVIPPPWLQPHPDALFPIERVYGMLGPLQRPAATLYRAWRRRRGPARTEAV